MASSRRAQKTISKENGRMGHVGFVKDQERKNKERRKREKGGMGGRDADRESKGEKEEPAASGSKTTML